MKWIDEFAKGTFGLFSGQILSGFQPLDFFSFLPSWYDIWIKKIADVIRKENLEEKRFNELKELMPPPSALRAILIKIIACYPALPEKNTADLKLVTDFLARMLIESCSKDPFAISSNPLHSDQEIEDLIIHVPLMPADIEIARILGRLNTGAGSLVHGIYNDVVTDLGWDVYGPYNVKKDAKEYSILIRDFTNFRPKGLWPEEFFPSVQEIKIYNLYDGVKWAISSVGCHTVSLSGNPVEGMRYYAVNADGKFLNPEEIKKITSELLDKAEKIYKKIRTMNFEELKEKVVWQESQQLKKFFQHFGVEWEPEDDIWKRVQNKPMPKAHLPNNQMMTTVEEYKEIFGINRFAIEVLKD